MSSRNRSDDRKRLIEAAQKDQLKEVKKLSRYFSNDVKVLSEALIESCVSGRLNVVTWLVSHTIANVNYNEKEELWLNTPLTAACVNGHLDIVKYLVKECKANVNLPDRMENTSLVRACLNVRMSVSKYLLCEVSELDVNSTFFHNNNTALHYVVWHSKDDNTQLHQACITGDVTEVSRLVFLIDNKINVQDNNGDTPLHKACYHGHSEIIKTLMLVEADETITNDEGETPTQVAESYGHSELLPLLDRGSLWQVMQGRERS